MLGTCDLMTVSTQPATPRPSIPASDTALLILLLTAGAYAIAFEYQAGYLSHFGIPETLCEVTPRELIVSGGALLGFATSIFFLTNWALDVLPKSWPTVVRRRVVVLMLLLVLAINAATYSGGTRLGVILLVGIPAVMLLGELLMPLLAYSKLPTYAAKLEASVRADLSLTTPADSAIQALYSAMTPIVAILIFFLVIAAFIAQGLGERAAREQKTYLVSNDYYTPCVVVAALSEGLLCVAYRPDTRATIGEYRFIKPEGASVTLRETGRLQAATPIPREGTHPES